MRAGGQGVRFVLKIEGGGSRPRKDWGGGDGAFLDPKRLCWPSFEIYHVKQILASKDYKTQHVGALWLVSLKGLLFPQKEKAEKDIHFFYSAKFLKMALLEPHTPFAGENDNLTNGTCFTQKKKGGGAQGLGRGSLWGLIIIFSSGPKSHQDSCKDWRFW